jgi:hypothetical protein
MFGSKKREAQRKAALEESMKRNAAIKAERESTILNKIDSGLAEAATTEDFTDKLEKLEALQNFHTSLKQGEAAGYYFYQGSYKDLDAPFKEAIASRGEKIDAALEKLLLENYAPLSKPTVQKAFFELHPGLVDRFNKISLKVEFAKAKAEADAEVKANAAPGQEAPAASKRAYGPYPEL